MTNIKAKLRELSPAELEAVIGGSSSGGNPMPGVSPDPTTPSASLG
jgi:hypothetical protein